MHLFLWIAGSTGALIGVGFLYQWIGGHRDRLRFAGSGRLVTIGRGYKLYLLEKGSTEGRLGPRRRAGRETHSGLAPLRWSLGAAAWPMSCRVRESRTRHPAAERTGHQIGRTGGEG